MPTGSAARRNRARWCEAFSLADSGMALALMAEIEHGQGTDTATNVGLMNLIAEGSTVGSARIIRKSRRVAFPEVRANVKGQFVAVAGAAFAIVKGR